MGRRVFVAIIIVVGACMPVSQALAETAQNTSKQQYLQDEIDAQQQKAEEEARKKAEATAKREAEKVTDKLKEDLQKNLPELPDASSVGNPFSTDRLGSFDSDFLDTIAPVRLAAFIIGIIWLMISVKSSLRK